MLYYKTIGVVLYMGAPTFDNVLYRQLNSNNNNKKKVNAL